MINFFRGRKMKRKFFALLSAIIVSWTGLGLAAPVENGFTYQGRLLDANLVADGQYDFQFSLWNDPNSINDTNQVSADINVPDFDIIDGYFTVILDFNGPNDFDGEDRWLEIGIRPGELADPNIFTKLTPRQQITPAPTALHAERADSAPPDDDWIMMGYDMYCDVPGNIGIGTPYPVTKLDIRGAINTINDYRIRGQSALSVEGDNVSVGTGGFEMDSAAGKNQTESFRVRNTFLGFFAGLSNWDGSYNTFIGASSGFSNYSGNYNTFVGHESGYSNDGERNTFLGGNAGYSNTDAANNTFVGYEAGYSSSESNDINNTFVGYRAGYNNGGEENTFVGNDAGYGNTKGNYNAFFGSRAGLNNQDSFNTFIGSDAGVANTKGNGCTFVGHLAGYRNTEGDGNVFLGSLTGFENTTGHHNVFVGNLAGKNSKDGDYNVFVGQDAGYSNNNGNENICMGYKTGYKGKNNEHNTYIGFKAGFNTQNGNNNVFIGYQAGHDANNVDNLLYIENSNSTTPLIYGEFDNDIVAVNGSLGAGTMSPQRSLHVNDVMRLEPRASAPSSPSEGDMYMDSTTHKLMVYDGSNWQGCW